MSPYILFSKLSSRIDPQVTTCLVNVSNFRKIKMSKNTRETTPGDGLRSLRSTMLFRAVNYELYVKPNKAIMIFGAITMLGCSGYMFYMNRNHKRDDYQTIIKSDDTMMLVRKESKWAD